MVYVLIASDKSVTWGLFSSVNLFDPEDNRSKTMLIYLVYDN